MEYEICLHHRTLLQVAGMCYWRNTGNAGNEERKFEELVGNSHSVKILAED